MTALHASFVSDVDGREIATYAWTGVEGPASGIVQIAHGLGEHAARYDRFASALNRAGYLAFANDHRGHGRTDSGRLGDFGDEGFPALIADVAQYSSHLAGEYGLPLFLFGHSMGSFAAQSLIVDRNEPYAGVVLSGSTAIDLLAAGMADAEEPAGLEAFNVGFEHRTGFEWLSRDEAEVDRYVADPWCGFDTPPEMIPQLFADGARLADPAVLSLIRTNLAILAVSGSDDPLAGGGQLVEVLGQRYVDGGLADVTIRLYPRARHEILNETNRDEVTADIIGWIVERTDPTGGG